MGIAQYTRKERTVCYRFQFHAVGPFRKRYSSHENNKNTIVGIQCLFQGLSELNKPAKNWYLTDILTGIIEISDDCGLYLVTRHWKYTNLVFNQNTYLFLRFHWLLHFKFPLGFLSMKSEHSVRYPGQCEGQTLLSRTVIANWQYCGGDGDWQLLTVTALCSWQ